MLSMKDVLAILLFMGCGYFHVNAASRPRKAATDLLLPVNSTTALMCEPVFAAGPATKASWYRNGEKLDTVTSSSNVIYLNRNYSTEKPMPQVGFLIITQVQKEDSGEYWCRLETEEATAGELFNLRVAYVDKIPSNGHIRVEPSAARLGEPLWMHCPLPKALPRPSVTWTIDSSPISSLSSDALAYPNGSLYIRRFSELYFGRFECLISNFAAKTKTSLVLNASNVGRRREATFEQYSCGDALKSGVLWFLAGCLATSMVVLIYLLLALIFIQPTARATYAPSSWLRSSPLLGPGFRKAVRPLPDYLVPSRTQSEI